jgi:hypothetical protein
MEFKGLPEFLQGNVAENIMRDERIKAVTTASALLENRMKAVSPNSTGRLRDSWQIMKTVDNGKTTTGGTKTSVNYALVWDNGTEKNPFPPMEGEPALGSWIRKELGLSGAKSQRDMRSMTFIIGRAIKARGLPSDPSKKGIFTNAFNAMESTLRAVQEAMIANIIRRANKQ